MRFVLAALAAMLVLPAAAADPPKCKLVRIAEWPVQMQRGLPVIEGAINGKKVGILLDTGAFASMITKDAAQRLDLVTRSTSEFVVGFGGESRVLVTRIDELDVAGAVRKGMRVRVGGERALPGVDFILGDDFFKSVDIEFDYAKGRIRLYQPVDCDGAFLAFWDRGASELALEDDGKPMVTIHVNGREAHALIDSGAASSVVSAAFAEKVGVSRDSAGVVPGGCSVGVGSDSVRSWLARFEAIAIGAEKISDARVRIADYTTDMSHARTAPPDVILGTDFLRAHRLLVSRSQRKAYFSYVGGDVFVSPRARGHDCDSREGRP